MLLNVNKYIKKYRKKIDGTLKKVIMRYIILFSLLK